VAEAFDRAGLRLNSSGAITVYQAPTDPGAGTSLVLSLLAAHRSSNSTEASLEITIASAAGQTLATPVQRQAIGPGMAIELMPNRVVLLPGERLRAKSSPGGVVDLMTSVLAPELLGNRRGIPSMEVYARYLPPDTVGTDQNVVELPAAVAVNVNFEEPAVLTGFAVQVPPTGADVSFPETVVLIQGIPFGAVTVEPVGLSLELQAEVPFIQAGSAPFFVPAAGIELAAAAPTVATGASVSPAALALEISAVAPDVVASSFDADAAAYIAAVEAADAQALDPAVGLACNAFIVGAKADGTWDKIESLGFFAGPKTLAGALVPVKGTAPTNVGFRENIDSDYENVTLLMRMNGPAGSTTSFIDEGIFRAPISSSSGSLSTAQFKYGRSAYNIATSSQFLSFANRSYYHVTTGEPFTVEAWVYNRESAGRVQYIMRHQHTTGFNDGGWQLAISQVSNEENTFFFSYGTGSGQSKQLWLQHRQLIASILGIMSPPVLMAQLYEYSKMAC
jgi:hypothetical protein